MIPLKNTFTVAVLLATSLMSVVVKGNFKFEIQVVDFNDPVNDCGGGFDICVLYIEEICLSPQTGSGSDEDCSLGEYNDDLDLDNLPRTVSILSTQPWPVDLQLYIEIKDSDIGSDDDIDDIFISKSLNTSSQFTNAVMSSGNRISLILRFRVQCIDNYEGPYCDCLPRDDENGHYTCKEDGEISCLPGYTNTSSLCTQDICSGVVCLPNAVCISNLTTYHCQCPEGMDCDTAAIPSIDPPNPSITNGCNNCNNNSLCIENENGVYHCVYLEGYTGEGCSTSTTNSPQSRTEPAMSGVVIAGIVTGILLAVVLCVVLVIIIVCIRLRKRRKLDVKLKSKPEDNSSAVARHPLAISLSNQSHLVSNPTYGQLNIAITYDDESHSGDTLRHMENPIYNGIGVDNTLYKGYPAKSGTAKEGIYSVPKKAPHASPPTEQKEVIYSDPDQPHTKPIGVDENGYSYTVVGENGDGGGKKSVYGNEYALATALSPPSSGEDAPYNTLDHGITQSHKNQERLAVLSTAYETLNTH